MKSSEQSVLAFAAVILWSVAAQAAHVDMTDPRRSLGREDDVRVDAQLGQGAVSTSAPISVTYQVQNLSKAAIAIADKISDLSYDADSQTITFSIGAEIPAATMPHLVTIGAGATKTFTAGAVLRILTTDTRTPFTALPRFVQVRVNILRNLDTFGDLFARQLRSSAPIAFSSTVFDQWVENNDSIFLNAIPVQWEQGASPGGAMSAEQRSPSLGSSNW